MVLLRRAQELFSTDFPVCKAANKSAWNDRFIKGIAGLPSTVILWIVSIEHRPLTSLICGLLKINYCPSREMRNRPYFIQSNLAEICSAANDEESWRQSNWDELFFLAHERQNLTIAGVETDFNFQNCKKKRQHHWINQKCICNSKLSFFATFAILWMMYYILGVSKYQHEISGL